jgi:uncharacterized protein
MGEAKISIKNSVGDTLAGLENRPEGIADKNPAVILVHGFAANKDEAGVFVELADNLIADGFLVYRFDLSGCGESGGDYSETTITKLYDDLKSITDFVRGLDYIDQSRIGFIGFSLGVPTIIAAKPLDAKAVVFMSGVARPHLVLSKLFGEGYKPEEISYRTTAAGRLVGVKPEFWIDFDKYDFVESLKNWSVPVFIVHNINDDKVPLEEADLLYEAASGHKEKLYLEASGHAIRDSEALKKIAKWCHEQLNK